MAKRAMSALTTVLLNLFVIYAAARLAGLLCARLGQPAVIGELLAGVAIGPHVLGLVGVPSAGVIDLFGGDHMLAERALDLVLESFAEVGVIVLLFTVGLETRPSDLVRVGVRSALVGTLGVVTPFVFGFALMRATGHPGIESAFVATAMVATSIGITARVLQELGVLQSREARVILGAAVIDDVLGLIVLTIVSAASAGGSGGYEVAIVAGQAVAFIVFVAWAGRHVMRRFSVHVQQLDALTPNDLPLNLSLLLMLGLAALAGLLGLAGIIGAFLAGMTLAESSDQFALDERSKPIYEFLVPFFFVYIGGKVDPQSLADGGVLLLALAITAVAVVSKLLGASGAMWGTSRRSMAIVGVGMVPRGEVGLIVAGIGLSKGIVPESLFSVVVVMSLATTLITPYGLSALYRRGDTERGRDRAVAGEEAERC